MNSTDEIAEAASQSTEIDNKNISPADVTTAVDPKEESTTQTDQAGLEDHHEEVEVGAQGKRKKKSKKRPASKRGLGKPTGLEEYNADAPLTVEEAKEDNVLYGKQLPFAMRIMTAIQRYETRRRIDPERRDIFYKYLMFGGIDVTPNMFRGLSLADRREMDKDDLVTLLAQTSIAEDKLNLDSENAVWAVDFEGVMKAFISRRVEQFWDMPTFQSVKTVTTLLSNFMSYLLLHEVCPEHKSDVLSTRKFLDQVALDELWNAKQAERWLPGDFNIACSTLFGGAYSRNYNPHASWRDEKDLNPDGPTFVGMTDEEARDVVKFGIAAAASDEQTFVWVEHANADTVKVISVDEEGAFEITKVIPVTSEDREWYKANSPALRPVGRILAKKWHNPSARDEDLTPEEQTALAHRTKDPPPQPRQGEDAAPDYEFFLEEQILQYLHPGMKIEATIYTLNCNIMFLDTVCKVYCPFDTFLPNEMLVEYTKPRAVGVKKQEEEAEAAERVRRELEEAADRERERLKREQGMEERFADLLVEGPGGGGGGFSSGEMRAEGEDAGAHDHGGFGSGVWGEESEDDDPVPPDYL